MTPQAPIGVEQKVVEILDSLQSGAVQVGDQLVKYSPDIADTALWIVRVDGMQSLLFAILSLLAIWGCALIAKENISKLIAEMEEKKKTATYPSLVEPGFISCFSVIIPLCICFIMTIATSTQKILFAIFDVWTYVAIFEPKLWLAKQIVTTVLSGGE